MQNNLFHNTTTSTCVIVFWIFRIVIKSVVMSGGRLSSRTGKSFYHMPLMLMLVKGMQEVKNNLFHITTTCICVIVFWILKLLLNQW